MGKMILITTDNEVKELEYPDGGLKSWKKLREHIGNGCELIEHVQPKRLYTEIGAGIEVKNVPGSKVSMLVDEEFYFHCDETKLNKIASWLYETDRHGYPILGNALIIGEKYGNAGIEFCEMSEEQFDLVFPKLKELGKRAEIKIKKQNEYGYYEIKVTSTSGLIHKREVKVSGKMSSPETKAKNENGFAPSIKADKTNPDKITFSIDKSDKVTSAKMYPIIDGKISKSAILDIDKKSGYVTSFTFAKEGMFRLVLLNKAGEKVASSTDFIISRKNNSDEWRIM